jgi:hypothetical protein
MLKGCGLALAIGAATVLLVIVATGVLTGEWWGLFGEWWILLLWVAMVAAPFGLLALAGVGARLPWLVGIALTTLLWAGFFLISYRVAMAGQGVALGPAFVMIFSPVLIAAACFLAARLAH